MREAASSATMVPRVRDHLVDYYGDGDGYPLTVMLNDTQAGMYLPVTWRYGEPRPWTVEEYSRNVVRWLRTAELFYVTPAMAAVVRQAAEDFPPYRIHRDDLPAQVGFCLYGDKVAEANPDQAGGNVVQIRGALWAPCQTAYGPGVHVVTFSDTDMLFTGEKYQQLAPELAEQMLREMPPLTYHDEQPMPYGDHDVRVRNTALAAVMSTWLLMGQRISLEERTPMPRQLRRQYQRAGRPDPVVRSVTLRRAKQASSPDQDGQGPTREYHHQWIVSGHWREQWYPSRGENKPLYIASYVKGPEGAPMIGGERVNVLRR